MFRISPLFAARVAATPLVALSGAPAVAQSWSALVLPGRVDEAVAAGGARADLVVFGGEVTGETAQDTWQLGGGTWTQSAPAVAPDARSGHAMTFVPDPLRPNGGTTVMFGGKRGTAVVNDTWTFDGNGWGTVQPATVPPPREGHDLIYDPVRDVVVMFGGVNSNANPPVVLDDTWIWDGLDWTRAFPSTTPGPRSDHAMAFDIGTGKVVLFGGSGGADTWEWNGTDWTLGTTLSPPVVSDYDIGTDPASGRVMMLNGNASGPWEVFDWDGTTWNPRVVGGMFDSVNRAEPQLTYDDVSGRLFLHGGELFDTTGSGRTSPLSDTWEWNGATWARVTAGAPAPRDGGAYAYDESRGQLVMLCGRIGCRHLADAWTFDGASWVEHPSGFSETAGPLPPAFATAGYDATRARCIMIGGLDDCFVQTRRFERVWDGSAWSDLNATSAQNTAVGGFIGAIASDLYSASMVHDRHRDRMVVVGGRYALSWLGSSAPSLDTWELDPVANHWTFVTPANTPAVGESRFQVTYDDARRQVVAVDATSLWGWDGTDWTAIPTIGFPGEGPIAFDASRRVLVLSNGTGTWELENGRWLQRTSVSRGDALFYDPTFGEVIGLSNTNLIWCFEPTLPATYRTFGSGCPAPFGTPALQGLAPAFQGSNLIVRVSPFPTGAPASMWFGFSDQSWAGLPLPVDLSVIGMNGCSIFVSRTAESSIGAAGIWALPIRVMAPLVGVDLFHQALILSPGANPLGVVVSDAAAARIGIR